MQVTIPEAKNRLSQLIRSVQAGAEVVIAEGGEPVARLVPATARLATTLDNGARDDGRAETILTWLTHHELPPGTSRSAEELDAAIVAERSAWD
jgi:prevent-host-death family protein